MAADSAGMRGAVHVQRQSGGVWRLTLDNPPMNPLGQAMRQRLIAAIDEAEADPESRVILLAATGKAFCAGEDLKDAEPAKGGPAGFGALLQRMNAARLPIVAAINGWCIGGGFELALTCDIRIASTDARFVCAGVNMGLMASAWRLPRLIGESRAKAMLLTGSPIDALTAESYGLVTALHEPDALADAGLAQAQRIASRAPLSVQATKDVASKAVSLSLEQSEAYQGPILAHLRASEDHREAVAAFREKREPVFRRQ